MTDAFAETVLEHLQAIEAEMAAARERDLELIAGLDRLPAMLQRLEDARTDALDHRR